MAPWTGKLLQSTLDKLTASNVEATAQKLVNLVETRTQVQKLALLVSLRLQRAYTPTFHAGFDEQRRQIADRLVSALLACFANHRKPLKGVPTTEGLSGIPLLKADLLSSWLFDKTSIAPVATALYNCQTLTCEDVKAVVVACLDENYTRDTDKLGDAILLLEYAARELDRQDEGRLSELLASVKEHLDRAPEKACERKRCGDRIIPSLYDRFWTLVQRREEGWKQSPYGTNTFPSIVGDDDEQVEGEGPRSSGTSEDSPHTPPIPVDSYNPAALPDGEEEAAAVADSVQPSPWLAYFAAIGGKDGKGDPESSRNGGRRESDAKVQGQVQRQDHEGQVLPDQKQAVAMPLQTQPKATGSGRAKQRPGPIVPPTTSSDERKAARRREESQNTAGPSARAATLPSSSSKPDVAPAPAPVAFPARRRRKQSSSGEQRNLPPRSRCPSCSREERGSEATVAPDPMQPPISFDAQDDCIWVHLSQAGSPIKVKFDSTTRLGDASRLAKLFAAALVSPNDSPSSSSSTPLPIHFLPDGKVGQTLKASQPETKPIFVEYPEHMTLSQAREVGDRLADAVLSYQCSSVQ